jgi:hypothetical protein
LVALTAAVWLLLPLKDRRMEESRLAKNERRLLEPAPAQARPEAPAAARAPARAEPQGQADSSGSAFKNRADLAKAKGALDLEAGRQAADKDRTTPQSQAVGGETANMPAHAPAESLKQETKPAAEAPAPSTAQPAGTPPVAAAAPAAPPPSPLADTSAAAAAKQPMARDQLMKDAKEQAAQSGLASKALPQAGAPVPLDSLSNLTNALSFNNLAAATRLEKGAGTIQGGAQAPSGTRFGRLSGAVAPQAFVLASFRVEQSGQQLRVIDKDGSVYTGYLQAADAMPGQSPAGKAAQSSSKALQEAERKSAQAAPTTGQAGQKTASYFFRVTGTNLSLNQQVVFTGNLLPATNAATAAPSTNRSRRSSGGLPPTRAGGSPSPAPAPDALLPLRTSRISGIAVLPNGQVLEINAVPAKP